MATLSTEELDIEIADLTNKASNLHSEVISGIDSPLEELLEKEASYHQTVKKLDTLLAARDSFSVSLLPPPDEDLALLLDEESDLLTSIADAGHYEDIGEPGHYPVKGIPYKVTSSFGSRYDPVGLRGYTFHHGIDLKAPEKTPITAWFSGTVVSTGNSYGSGNYIWLDHGYGVRSYYCHLYRIDVQEGDNVVQGSQIALSGNTGRYTTGPHLHLGMYIDGTSVDPRVLLE